MKIFDCFTFLNELELLELRFMELYDTVDHFVLVEANRSHNGTPKEFLFEKNKDRYEKKYLDKLIYVKVHDMPEYDKNDIFKLEYFQRNAIMRGLGGRVATGDKILVSDLDEIPNIEAIKVSMNATRWILFKQTLFYYYVNCRVQRGWGGTVMADWGAFRNPQQLRFYAQRHSWAKPTEGLCPDGGWHYSYMTGGDSKRLKQKIDYFAESSTLSDIAGTPEKIKERMAGRKDLFDREGKRAGYYLEIVDILNNKPRMLDKFLEKYPNFIYKSN